jgi:hypothetical protein
MIWKDVAPALASRGFRVLVYGTLTPTPTNPTPHSSLLDLYGRGYSDAPQTTYNPALYATQLALLMQHIKWEKAHIVGVSMVS